MLSHTHGRHIRTHAPRCEGDVNKEINIYSDDKSPESGAQHTCSGRHARALIHEAVEPSAPDSREGATVRRSHTFTRRRRLRSLRRKCATVGVWFQLLHHRNRCGSSLKSLLVRFVSSSPRIRFPVAGNGGPRIRRRHLCGSHQHSHDKILQVQSVKINRFLLYCCAGKRGNSGPGETEESLWFYFSVQSFFSSTMLPPPGFYRFCFLSM